MEFEELLNKKPKTEAEAMLCQAIAALSMQPQFERMSRGKYLLIYKRHANIGILKAR